MKLTEGVIDRLKVERPGAKDQLFSDDEQGGLLVRITKTGSKSYLAQYTLHHLKWRVPLGACSAITLRDARKAAAALMGAVAQGKNPATERKAAAATEQAKRARDKLTLATLIGEWRRLHLTKKRPRYAAEAVRALNHAFRSHLDQPAADLDKTTIIRLLDPKGAVIAGRTAAYGRAAFAWTMKRGKVQANPFDHLPIAAGTTERDRILSDNEIAAIWRAAGGASPYGPIVRLLLLTGQRRDEVAGMTWGEIAADLSTWTIPGKRTKNGVPHLVPLSGPARDLLLALLPENEDDAKRALEERRATDALVFPCSAGTVFSAWSKSKTELGKAITKAQAEAAAKLHTKAVPVAPWRLHDLRRTFATGLQRLGVRLEVTEAALNHVSGSRAGIVGIYQRHDWADEKRAALDAWTAHVAAIIEDRPETSNVVQLGAAR